MKRIILLSAITLGTLGLSSCNSLLSACANASLCSTVPNTPQPGARLPGDAVLTLTRGQTLTLTVQVDRSQIPSQTPVSLVAVDPAIRNGPDRLLLYDNYGITVRATETGFLGDTTVTLTTSATAAIPANGVALQMGAKRTDSPTGLFGYFGIAVRTLN